MKQGKAFGPINLIGIALFLFCFAFVSVATAENGATTVTAMTRNMYPGAEFAAVAAARNEKEFGKAVRETIKKVMGSGIPERAALLASEIAATKPDLVALQEATTWQIESTSGPIVLDQLDLLLDALHAAGQNYKIAVVKNLTNVQVPGAVAYTDHDAILVRSDLSSDQMNIVGSETHLYDALLRFPVLDGEITVLRGWIALDVNIRGTRFKFVNTHLEAALVDVPQTEDLQFAQAAQLVEELKSTSLPIILAGDFNSDAETTKLYPPDDTPSYSYIAAAGYIDSWHELYPTNSGYTWPLLIEDQHPQIKVVPIERIDLIFTNRFAPISATRTGMDEVGGLYSSDHGGLVTVFKSEQAVKDR